MGKGKKGKSTGKVPTLTCAGCKNFKPGSKGSGWCARKDKKRSADAKPCGDFKLRK